MTIEADFLRRIPAEALRTEEGVDMLDLLDLVGMLPSTFSTGSMRASTPRGAGTKPSARALRHLPTRDYAEAAPVPTRPHRMHPMLENKPFFLKASAERVCLLLHGLGGGPYEMQPLAESLYAQGLSVLAVAYPGHDKPARRMPASTWPEWYGHIEATYRKLAGAFASISVVGFSTGCPLALHLAAHWPVAKLVLISPFVSVRHRWFYLLPPEAYLYSVGRLLPQVPRRRLPVRDRAMREAAEQAAYYRTFNLCAVRSALALVGTVKAELSLVRSPLLILQSRRDSVVAPSGAEYIYRRVRSRVRQLHWFDKSDHILPLDLERKEVYERVGRFLL